MFDLTAVDADGQVESWEELRHAVEESGGVLRVVMWLLRDLEQAGRLGVHVRASISRRLDGLGLAHLPADIPGEQYAIITLYKRGTPAAAVVDAVFRDGSSKAAEVALRRMNTSRDAEKLQIITEKVEELANILLDEE
ncbi:hypothetical protein PV726_43120 [Streptomyces europaeiscabiei]|uniref:hypothetical protein n=1 Tax=Streptomyces europaeiscabiei TaxID=146819 RepID=UPI0029B6651A|nr:hypothetical protein [Streptomyces europaeiscabiei]MDX3696923.1 hypothetical protein [Streptomyces europaeiscabiei]